MPHRPEQRKDITMWATISTVVGILLGLFTTLKTIADLNVSQGHKAILTRLGKPVRDRRKQPAKGLLPDSQYIDLPQFRGIVRIYGAGFVKRVPFLYKAKSMHAWERPIETEAFEITFRNHMQYHVKLFLNITIPDEGLYASLFVWDDFDRQIRAPMQEAGVIYSRRQEVPKDPEIMAAEILALLRAKLDEQPGMVVEAVRLRFLKFAEGPITIWSQQEEYRLRQRFFGALRLKRAHRDPKYDPFLVAALGSGSSDQGPGMPWTDIPGVEQSEVLDGDGLSAA